MFLPDEIIYGQISLNTDIAIFNEVQPQLLEHKKYFIAICVNAHNMNNKDCKTVLKKPELSPAFYAE